MSIINSISRIASNIRSKRMRYMTERSISALSPELRKDIGWPEEWRAGGFLASDNFR